jgi:hypothetical protein
MFKKFLLSAFVLAAHSAPSLGSIQINDFTGIYDVSNWTQLTEGTSSISLAGAPNSVGLLGSNTDAGFGSPAADVRFTIIAAASGLFEFDWNYVTTDVDTPFFDPAFYLNGLLIDLIQLTDDNGDLSQNGSISVPVLVGDVIGWQVTATDDQLGAATLVVSNFSAPAPDPGVVPEPLSVLVWGGLAATATVVLRRRRFNS